MSVNNTSSTGVVIPPSTIEDSKIKKRQRRTLRQLPLYRDMANMKYYVAKLYDITPRKYTKYLDGMLGTASEAKKCVGLAEATLDSESRAEYLTMARVFVEDVQDDLTILRQLNQIDAGTEKKMKSLAKSIVAQCVAWRDYARSEGA